LPISTIQLSVDGKIVEETQSPNPKLAIVGFHLSGMSETKRRLELSSAQFQACSPIDIALETSPSEVTQTIEASMRKPSSVLLLHDYWQNLSEAKDVSKLSREYLDSIEHLRTFFSKSSRYKIVRHVVEEEDAVNIVRRDWQDLQFNYELPEFLKKAILDFSRFDNTHVPRLIHEALDRWIREEPATSEILKKQARLDQEKERIRTDLEVLSGDLKRRAKERNETLTLLGIGVSASLAANVLNAVQTIAKAAAGPALLSSGLAFPVVELLVVGSAIGFSHEKKRALPEGLKKKFEEYSAGFLSAQAYWNSNELTPTEKDLICYKMDCAIPLPQGTAKRELEAHFMTSQERLKVLGDQLLESLKPDLLEELDEILTPVEEELSSIVKRLASLEADVSQLKKTAAIQDEWRKGANRFFEDTDAVMGIYRRVEDLGLTRQGEKWLIRGELGEPDIELVRTSDYDRYVGAAGDIMRKQGIVVLVGPQGIGKSVLGKYVLALGLTAKEINLVIDEGRIGERLEEEARRFQGAKPALYYDPSPQSLYQTSQLKGPKMDWSKRASETSSTVGVRINEVLSVSEGAGVPALIVLTEEQLSNEPALKKRIEKDNQRLGIANSFVVINLKKEDFVRGIVSAYSGSDLEGIERLVPAVLEYSVGYTLVGMYAGKWLAQPGESGRVERALVEGGRNAKLFFKYYIRYALLKDNESEFARLTLPLLAHSYMGSPFSAGQVLSYPSMDLMTLPMAKLLSRISNQEALGDSLAKWISHRHPDLMEDAISELGECVVWKGSAEPQMTTIVATMSVTASGALPIKDVELAMVRFAEEWNPTGVSQKSEMTEDEERAVMSFDQSLRDDVGRTSFVPSRSVSNPLLIQLIESLSPKTMVVRFALIRAIGKVIAESVARDNLQDCCLGLTEQSISRSPPRLSANCDNLYSFFVQEGVWTNVGGYVIMGAGPLAPPLVRLIGLDSEALASLLKLSETVLGEIKQWQGGVQPIPTGLSEHFAKACALIAAIDFDRIGDDEKAEALRAMRAVQATALDLMPIFLQMSYPLLEKVRVTDREQARWLASILAMSVGSNPYINRYADRLEQSEDWIVRLISAMAVLYTIGSEGRVDRLMEMGKMLEGFSGESPEIRGIAEFAISQLLANIYKMAGSEEAGQWEKRRLDALRKLEPESKAFKEFAYYLTPTSDSKAILAAATNVFESQIDPSIFFNASEAYQEGRFDECIKLAKKLKRPLQTNSLAADVAVLGLVAQIVKDGPSSDVVTELLQLAVASLITSSGPMRISAMGVCDVMGSRLSLEGFEPGRKKDIDLIQSSSIALGADPGIASLTYGFLSIVAEGSSPYDGPFLENLRKYASRQPNSEEAIFGGKTPPRWAEPALALYRGSISEREAFDLCNRMEGDEREMSLRAMEELGDESYYLRLLEVSNRATYKKLFVASARNRNLNPLLAFDLVVAPWGLVWLLLLGLVEGDGEIVSCALDVGRGEHRDHPWDDLFAQRDRTSALPTAQDYKRDTQFTDTLSLLIAYVIPIVGIESFELQAGKALPDYADSLNGLGLSLMKKGDTKGAIAAYEQAITLLRQSTAEDGSHLTDLALALNNLGNAQRAKGELEKSITLQREAISILRTMVLQDKSLAIDLGDVLNDLGADLEEKGNFVESISSYEEAIIMYRRCALDDERKLSNFALTLQNLADVLSKNGSEADAIPALKEAVEIRKTLASRDEKQLPALARALSSLGNALSSKGDLDEGIARLEEALQITEPLARGDVNLTSDLARRHLDIGVAKYAKGDLQGAIASCRRALDLYRALSRGDSGYLPRTESTLIQLGRALSDAGELGESVSLLTEASESLSDLVLTQRHLALTLAEANLNLAVSYCRLGDKIHARYYAKTVEEFLKTGEYHDSRAIRWLNFNLGAVKIGCLGDKDGSTYVLASYIGQPKS
jgi:tetratricopeptide (TPR) repeat protein